MQKNILWTGIEYHSIENCIVTITEGGADIKSSVIGCYNSVIYKLDYQITTNHLWETTFFMIKSQLNDFTQTTVHHSDGKGNWFENGQHIEKLKGCIDIDISLTPFTNTLPINRLKLSEKPNEQIQVLYVDILGQQTNPVHQKYTRLSHNEYKYENVPNDFESIISVDDFGLVVKYPKIFERSHIIESNYR
jgi:uncharacterized protein